MKLTTMLRTIAACVFAAAGITIGAALPAAAATHRPAPRPVVFITDNYGTDTTPCVVYPGETLTEFGYGTGTFTVESVTPKGPVYLVTLSGPLDNDTVPHQSSLVYELRT